MHTCVHQKKFQCHTHFHQFGHLGHNMESQHNWHDNYNFEALRGHCRVSSRKISLGGRGRWLNHTHFTPTFHIHKLPEVVHS